MNRITATTLLTLLALAIAATLSWKIFINSPTIENSTYICNQVNIDEYNFIVKDTDFLVHDFGNDKLGDIEYYIEFPFNIPNDNKFKITLMNGFYKHAVFYDTVIQGKAIKFSIPKLDHYPSGYLLNFSLYSPSEHRICVWGLEETIPINDPVNYTHSWRVKLLTYAFETEFGSRRSTVFKPRF